jgi:hypothetical protein
MKKSRFGYDRAAVSVAIAAMILVQTMALARNAHAFPGATSLDIASEHRALQSFDVTLAKLETTCADLSKKPSIATVEFASAKSQADDVKSRVSEVQQAIRSTIDKLKAAGAWDGLDAKLLAKITNERVRSLLRDNGGPKRILEDAASQFGRLSADVDSLVQKLNSKVHAQRDSRPATDLSLRAVRVAFNPEPLSFGDRVRCGFRMVLATVEFARNEQLSDETVSKLTKACGTPATS